MAAWCAASTGYLAGLGEEALRLALEHARSRHAFGGPLAALEPVQQMLADAATLVDGLTLLSADSPGADALAHAGEATERAVGDLHAGDRRARLHARVPAPARLPAQPRGARMGGRGPARLGESGRMTGAELPLDGLRVLDYGQYVASPFATMLLADLGADVIKVEPPRGDEWRRYDPFEDGESRYFYALNRGKRSVALDLKTAEGRERSRALIASADALVHNCLPERARRFGLDAESVRAVNPRCVTVCVSAFGSDGPDSNRPAYDLIGQALSGLLLADPRPGDAVPRRTGGLALADFTAGLLAALAVTAGPARPQRARARARGVAPGRGARAAGAALRGGGGLGDEARAAGSELAGRAELEALAARAEALEALDPYYRAHACADGFIALACLNTGQRRQVCELLGLEDPFADNPQAEPADAGERERRAAHVRAVEDGFARLGVREAVAALGRAARARERGAQPQPALRRRAGARERPRPGRWSSPASAPCGCSAAPSRSTGPRPARGRPAPALGEHADELLGAPARR